MSDKYPGGFVTAGAPAGFSVAFDGTGDYLNTATNAAFSFGTGDFTIEAWVYVNAQSGFQNFVDTRTSQSSSSTGVYFGVNTGSLALVFYKTGATLTSTSSITAATWTHVALVRSGTTVTIYINGTASGTVTDSTNFTDNSFYAGSQLVGYMSNVRVNKGTAVYTTNFTPPTQMFPISGTSILTAQSPTIIDNSSNAFTVTANGNAAVSTFTPFPAYTGFNPALGAAAGGVWTLDEAAYYQNNRIWPIYDPYFNQTTLMLHGNGTNGAQNNTFLDSSTNNFTIIRNGNTTQGSFSPFSQTGWSTYFPGSGTNYVQTPSSSTSTILGGSLTSLGSLSFTIECFINTPGNIFVVGACDPTGGTADMILSIGSDGTLSFGATFSGYTTRTSTGAAPLNTWCHVAWVVTGGYVNFYVNGAPAGSATVGNTSGSYGQLVFSGYNNSFTSKLAVSNFRVTKSALYTSAFTPPTSQLTAITNTTLLAFQANSSSRDNSANNYALTVVGAPSVQAFSPFVPAYITPTTYSNRFAATSYLSMTSNAAFALPGAFTIEFWIYFSTFEAANRLIAGVQTSGGLTFYTNGTTISPNVFGTGNIFTASNTVSAGQWYHYALSRDSSNNMRMWVNGLSVGSTTTATSYVQGAYQINDSTGSMAFVMSNLRIVKGSTVYDPTQTNITPPIAPLTAVTNTVLLTCQSSTFVDNSTNNFSITPSGTVQPTVSPTPFNPNVDTTTLNSAYSTSLIGGSGYFDGTSDYLSIPANAGFQFDGDFTVECWFYSGSGTTASKFDQIVGTIVDATTGYWRIGSEYNGGKQFWFTWTTGTYNDILTNFSVSDNAWHHLAVTRISNSVRLFVDGVQKGSTTTVTTNLTASAPLMVMNSTQGSNQTQGYVGSLRIIKGQGIYSTAFSPQRTPFTAISGTTVLLNFTNGAIFDNTAKNVLETVGGITLSTTQAKYGNTSMSFNGTTGYLKGNANLSQNVAFGTGDFTIECWVYATSIAAGTSDTIIDARPGSNTGDSFLFYLWDGGKIAWYVPSVGGYVVNTGTVTANTWTHIAICRSGTTFRSFKDGVLQQTATNSTSYMNPGAPYPYIGGAYHLTGDFFRGYIDDLRITKGYARYVANFTPPTSQLQDQ